MKLLSSTLTSISVQSRVKYISLSLIGISVVAGVACEEMSGAKISFLLSQLENLIPWKELGRGGQEASQGISQVVNGLGSVFSEGVKRIYQLGEQVVGYFPRAISMIDNLFQTGMKYATESDSLSTKWGSVYLIVKQDTAIIIKNWIISLVNVERLFTLIKLPWTIFMNLNKVEMQSAPKQKGKKYALKNGNEVWNNKSQEDGGYCWECFGIVLLRPRKSLKEIKQINKGVWTIYPM